MGPELQQRVVVHLAGRLAVAAGVGRPLAGDEVAAVATADLFADLVIDGRSVDSLALTEVLVQVEEELDVSLFDDDRADDARTLGDLVDILGSHLDADVVAAWVDRTP